jgi:hypothetical protein
MKNITAPSLIGALGEFRMCHTSGSRIYERTHTKTQGLATFLGVGTQFDTTALSCLLQLGLYRAHKLHFGAKLY